MRRRGYRGWTAAFTVAMTLSLVFLAVQKHIRLPVGQTSSDSILSRDPRVTALMSAGHFLPQWAAGPRTTFTREKPPFPSGILLTVDPGLASNVESVPITHETALIRASAESVRENTSRLIRRPPEPAANVVLYAPIADLELTDLPLHRSRTGIFYLMEAMDEAFQRPTQVVSVYQSLPNRPSFPIDSTRVAEIPSPAQLKRKLPEPTALVRELEDLQQQLNVVRGSDIANPLNRSGKDSRFVATPQPSIATAEAVLPVNLWIAQVQSELHRLGFEYGLEHPASRDAMNSLSQLANEAVALGNAQTDYSLATQILRVAYALERRVAVWTAVQECLDGTTIALARPRNPDEARRDLLAAIGTVEEKIVATGDGPAWRKFLLLDELTTWAESSRDIWNTDEDLSQAALERLHWANLREDQRTFLAQEEFQDLAAHLVIWGRDPIDHRQLLVDLEELEQDPISRIRTGLAGNVQVLRLSSGTDQRLVSKTIDNHYRNANLRMSISSDLIERFLPQGTHEVRPVRRRILGADTSGNSTVRTQLELKLIPDPSRWSIDLGVSGDLQANTRSSKGPAVIHSTSTAQINSHRYVRLGRDGYEVSSQPTSVASQDQLQKLSTTYDGLPVIGQLVRLLVREQFDQKHGLAQRISRRIIAQETDMELDRRLEEAITQAEQELNSRLLGPLERLQLNPTVISMNTSEERLTIRYRVASEAQLAAHTPRPRAPTDSLMSMQLHESSLNNTIEQLGLSGRTWTLSELATRIGEILNQKNWTVAEELQDVTIRFADTRPITVEFRDGTMRLTLRIADFQQPSRGLQIQRFIVSSNYVPVAEGLNAELIRDGHVEIISQRDRLALRVIFAKVFVSRPEIPLISESWRDDSRAQGLAVSQLDIRDGWLAVAVSDQDTRQAEQVAARARSMKLQ